MVTSKPCYYFLFCKKAKETKTGMLFFCQHSIQQLQCIILKISGSQNLSKNLKRLIKKKTIAMLHGLCTFNDFFLFEEKIMIRSQDI